MNGSTAPYASHSALTSGGNVAIRAMHLRLGRCHFLGVDVTPEGR
jgi:hypothetical protein